MNTYTIKELDMLYTCGYIRHPMIKCQDKWYNGYIYVNGDSDEYSKILLTEIDINCSDSEIIDFLRKCNSGMHNRGAYLVPLPCRCGHNFLFLNQLKLPHEEVVLCNFMCTGRDKYFYYTNHRGIECKLGLYTEVDYIDILIRLYPNAKEEYDNFIYQNTVNKLAGMDTEEPLKIKTFKVDKIDRSDITLYNRRVNVLTSLGLVKLSFYYTDTAKHYLNNSKIVKTPVSAVVWDIPNMTDIDNIVNVKPYLFDSIEVIGDKIKVWVICTLTLNGGIELIGKLPIRYCTNSLLSDDFVVTIKTKEGSISLEHSLLNKLDSTFTLDEMFSVIPSHKEKFKEILNSVLEEGYLQ